MSENDVDYERLTAEWVEEGPEAGAFLVVTNEDHTDVFARTEPGRDARWVALWMLGAAIEHVTHSARDSGGNVTMDEVAHDAIAIIREQYGDR